MAKGINRLWVLVVGMLCAATAWPVAITVDPRLVGEPAGTLPVMIAEELVPAGSMATVTTGETAAPDSASR